MHGHWAAGGSDHQLAVVSVGRKGRFRVSSLKRIEPIEYATAAGKNRLRIRYAASCVGFREIERLLDEAQVTRPSSLWWRLKSGWYAFLDQNARSNAMSGDGECCSRPPGLSRRSED